MTNWTIVCYNILPSLSAFVDFSALMEVSANFKVGIFVCLINSLVHGSCGSLWCCVGSSFPSTCCATSAPMTALGLC